MTEKKLNHRIIKEALLIRKVEEKFLELFGEGRLNGTVHTCVGQEFSAVAFAGQLKKKDFIFSNHRCHGHYLSFTGDVRGLIAELLGKACGTSGGIGSSQHLCKDNFYSNGIQGGIVPVAAGYALANKLLGNDSVGIVFIGDGTLGEGVLYETMNIVSKWEIPLMIVCENNFYSQSTPQAVNVAGDILDRAKAFGIVAEKGNTWEPDILVGQAERAIDYVRQEKKPLFFQVDTYRLNAHSKGDDDRSQEEVTHYKSLDFLNKFRDDESQYYKNYLQEIQEKVNGIVEDLLQEKELSLDQYHSSDFETEKAKWEPLLPQNKRLVELINTYFKKIIQEDQRVVFIGEDIHSPYGGAFKITKDLSNLRPEKVFTTPISEAALTGIANGLALNGFKPYAEIMFGDFMTLALDQIVNHASKFHHMFNKQVNCPMVIRTPMGGRRGYGPTHSQTLDKFLIGIDNVKTIAINTFFDPAIVYASILKEEHPVIVIENKTDYGKKILNNKSDYFNYERTIADYPLVRVFPINSQPDLTIVTYGGMADYIHGFLEELFLETDLKPEMFVLSEISKVPVGIVLQSLAVTRKMLVIEEGSAVGGIGSEIIASVQECADFYFSAKRIAALPVPIPAVKSLEEAVLPGKNHIIQTIKEKFS